MNIKVKVNLPKDIYTIICNDMDSFEFKKENGTINKNKFINQLLENYYEDFLLQEEELEKRIRIILKDNATNNIDNLISLINTSEIKKNDQNYDCSLQFIISKSNEKIYQIIEKYYLRERSISQYFREMLISYCSYSQWQRERFLFKKNAQLISTAIKEKKKIIISGIKGETLIIEPYKIKTTKEELYNYIIGYINTKKGNRMLISRKLYKIVDIHLTNESFSFSKIEINNLEATIEHGAQFPINEESLTILELTPEGEKNYQNFYLNRPSYYKKENNIYYFTCSYNQIEFYFFRFGKQVKIISPAHLQRKFKRKYYEAFTKYRKNPIKNN